jgi:methionyl-tRNA formyltransferase
LKLIFAGTPEFALPSLQALAESQHTICAVYTQPDRPQGRGRRLLPSPIKQFALEKGWPVLQPLSLRSLEAQQTLAAWQADLMIVVAYGLILPKAVLTLPKKGCVNVHASLLPRWRGAAPIQRALLAGDSTTGISIMQMDAGLDTGDVIQQVACAIGPNETGGTLQVRLAELGAQALLSSLEQIATGDYPRVPQPESGSTYAKKIEKNEAEIQWTQSAVEIERAIRALNPKPVAYTFLNNQPVRIWQAQVLAEVAQENLKPGTCIQVSDQGLDVLTGQGILRILQLQWPGGRCLPVKAVLHSKANQLFSGATFGSTHDK